VRLQLLPAVVGLLVPHNDGELGRFLVLGSLLDIIGILVDPGPVSVVVRGALVDILGLAHRPHHHLGLVLLLGVLCLIVAVLLVIVLLVGCVFLVLLVVFLVVTLVVALLAFLFLVLLILRLLLLLIFGLCFGVGFEGGSGCAGPAVRELPRLGGAPRFLGAGAERRPATRHCRKLQLTMGNRDGAGKKVAPQNLWKG
jgi:hypothetical protein